MPVPLADLRMHKAAAAILCVVFGCPMAALGDSLAPFVDEAGGFEVLFPGNPSRASKRIKTPWGEAVSRTLYVRELSGGMLVS